MINKKINLKQNLKKKIIYSLFKVKIFNNNSFKNIHFDIIPFIYGIRHKYILINLKYIYFYFKQINRLIKNLIRQNKRILIIGNDIDIQFLIKKNLTKKNKHILLLNKKWIYGLLTNNLNKNNYYKQKKINLIILLKTTSNFDFLVKEFVNTKIPIISLINIDQQLKYINYPLIQNSKNIKSIFLLIYFIRKLGL